MLWCVSGEWTCQRCMNGDESAEVASVGLGWDKVEVRDVIEP
jgi:hypothetical protein